MTIRQRAVLAQDKHERHHAILDAAARLLRRAPDRVASVAEVADEAGLAKGTVYLYFPAKEALLLALHERNVGQFFDALTDRLQGAGPVTIDAVLTVIRKHMVEPPLFLPLASRCFGTVQQSVDATVAQAFRERMAVRLEQAGAGLERHFTTLPPGGGVVLLRHSYALILGLWQMSPSSGAAGAREVRDAPSTLRFAYPADLDRALTALWRGTLAAP